MNEENILTHTVAATRVPTMTPTLACHDMEPDLAEYPDSSEFRNTSDVVFVSRPGDIVGPG